MSTIGRGAQVRLDGDAQAVARGGNSARLIDNIRQQQVLVATGAAADGNRADGSTVTGAPALDEVLAPNGRRFAAADYGVVADGITDCTDALRAAEADSGPGDTVVFPSGTICFSQPLAFKRQYGAWIGAGSGQTVFLYTGAATNVDLLTFGSGYGAEGVTVGVTLQGFRVQSQPIMTAKAGLRLISICQSNIIDVMLDGQYGNGHLWNGIDFDCCGPMTWTYPNARAQNDAVQVHGKAGSAQAGLFITGGGKICLSKVGIHVGGGYGGVYLDECDVIVNETNLKIDNALQAEWNREVFCGSRLTLDSATLHNLWINETAAPPGSMRLRVCMDGTWCATAAQRGVYVQSMPGGYLQITGGMITQNGTQTPSAGIRIDDLSTQVQVIGAWLSENTGWAIESPSSDSAVNIGNCFFRNNGLGDIHPNVQTGNGFTKGNGMRWGDADFGAYFQPGSIPTVSFAAGSFLYYDRTADAYGFWIDGTERFRISATGVSVGGVFLTAVPPNFANDAAAATGGVPVGGIYRNGSALMVRAA